MDYMETLKITKWNMEKRVSRFSKLKTLPIQIDENILQAGEVIVYARELLSVI